MADCFFEGRFHGREDGMERIVEGRVSIVTGAARGIGRATAELLCQHGARVVICDADREAAERTALALEGETIVFDGDQIGSASCRERVCQYMYLSVVAVSFNKKNTKSPQTHNPMSIYQSDQPNYTAPN